MTDFSLFTSSPFQFEQCRDKYHEMSEIDQLTIESLFNPNYNKNIIDIDYPINKVCQYLLSKKFDYKDLPHKYKINQKVIATFIKVLIYKEKSIELSYNDLLFKDQYLPIILIYDKDFIIKLLEIKACNTFHNYKLHYPNSFLLNDFDVNKTAVSLWCQENECDQYKILEDINPNFLPELYHFFLAQNPYFITDDDLYNDLDVEIEVGPTELEILLDNCNSLHKFILERYETPDNKYLTIEYLHNLIEKNVKLSDIYLEEINEIEAYNIFYKSVMKNGLNLKDVPEEFINEELVQLALTNNPLAIIVAPIEYINIEDLNKIFDIIDGELVSSLNIKDELFRKYEYFSEEAQLIIKGPFTDLFFDIDESKYQKISDLLRDNRKFLLKYVKFRVNNNGLLPVERYIEDYEVLTHMIFNDYIDVVGLDKISYMKYLITNKEYKLINKLLPYIKKFTIAIMYDLILIDKYNMIYFEEKYWDGIAINLYEQYLIKNTKEYMYFYIYLKSKFKSTNVDLNFINYNILSFLTINYEFIYFL